MRIFATSDLHTDFEANLNVVEGISRQDFTQDVLIVAGDIAHRLQILQDTLSRLVERFRDVFFVPGNHDLWVGDGEEEDSVGKFERIKALCDAIDVSTVPIAVGGWTIVPLLSWYDTAFGDDEEKSPPSGWADFRYCRWPADMGPPSQFFSQQNRQTLSAATLRQPNSRVITFSHFVPRRDLLPPIANLRLAGLLQVVGSRVIDRQLRQAGADIHVFGHSHIRCDREIEAVRYVQNSLGYPRQWSQRGFELKQIAED